MNEQPAPGVGEIWLTVAGLRIHCLTAGTSGPAVVLLHGSGFDAAGLALGPAMAALAPQCRVFAPDLPGFGDSAPLPAGWGFAEQSAFLDPLLTALGLGRASLVGHSMGGGVALGFALAAPARVARLALIDSACLMHRTDAPRRAWLAAHLPGLTALQWRWLARSRGALRHTLLGAMPHRPERVTPSLLDAVTLRMRKHSGGATLHQWERREVAWHGLRTCYLDRLPALAVPTLILHGEDDPMVPVAIAREAHRRIPDARLEIIPQCGHLAPLEQPETVSRALARFLQAA
jgi:pimeloyl-ACP methyl ester carboxylesterase